MDLIEMFMVLRAIIHTFVRFLPLGLYSFAYLSTAVFKDKRGGLLLLGLVINDVIGYLYKRYTKYEPNENCAMFGKKDDASSIGFLPNSHVQYMSFVSAFFYSDMWLKYKLDFIPFFFILFLLIITIWSRISIGCQTFKGVMYNIIFGALVGIVYFYFISRYYRDAVTEMEGQKACDMGYDDYQCNEIMDGTVIIKDPKERVKKMTDEERYNYYSS